MAQFFRRWQGHCAVLAAVAKGQCHCCRLLVLEGEQCRLHWSADDGAAFSFRLERTLTPIFKSNAAQPQHALGFPEVTAAPRAVLPISHVVVVA